ncbi:Panacea domain-containing protein [Clostridium sp. DSM 100503]|uniref:Panacea domain-containing protein n=1 Tax=Clostridium sp. DSM 100503 TaxID=2963282 RepID=UPI002149B737|nr:Panacea domain-containing protein [Clostridium sp. DSM 100503]MCR1952938.1 Panacea domain-containing protein [Clostridium sp. DSM 100503]
MYQHLLLIYSDYSKEERVGFYRRYDSIEEALKFTDIVEKVKEAYKHLTFSFHHIQTESEDIYSIESYDPYFRDINYILDLEEYIKLIKTDVEVKPIDIAKIILSKKSFCQLALEKIMYFVDCEYIKKYGEPIFRDEFQAWDFGPVIPNVYKKYKSFGYDKISLTDEEKLIICSKMMKFKDYDRISSVIDEVIEKYKGYTANDLVTESHKDGSPWDLVYKNGLGKNKKISKSLVKQCIEEGYLSV